MGQNRFEILAVIDLRGGLAVRAKGGHRDRYRPIEQVAGEPIPPGDAGALAGRYVERFGLDRLYVADLDAIERGRPQDAALSAIRASGASMWLDRGIASTAEAGRAMDVGAERVIVGLETLPSFDVLESVCEVAGDRVVFSLDLRNGVPIAAAPDLGQASPEALAARAVDAGAGAVIVLDLARVGSGSGVDVEMLARIRSAAPAVPVYAGGGVRRIGELEQLQHAGCDGALVASALLDGSIPPGDLGRYLRTVSTVGTPRSVRADGTRRC